MLPIEKLKKIAKELNEEFTLEDIKSLNNSKMNFNSYSLIANSKYIEKAKRLSDGLYYEDEIGTIYVFNIELTLTDNSVVNIYVFTDRKKIIESCQKGDINISVAELELVCKKARALSIENIVIEGDMPVISKTSYEEMDTLIRFYDFNNSSGREFYYCSDLIRNFIKTY